jgi:ATP-binding cassette, subfamily F, member 3
VIWLERYLQSLTSTTILIVAHDRDFLDTVTSETIVLRGQKLSYFEGSISEYERAAMKERKNRIRAKDALDRKRVAIEKSIKENVRMAVKTGDDKRAKVAKSKQKKLDERFGAEVNAKGHR